MYIETEKLEFEKYGFTDIIKVKEYDNGDLEYKMKYRGNDMEFWAIHDKGQPTFHYNIEFEKEDLPYKKKYNAAGQFFPMLLKVVDKYKQFQINNRYFKTFNNKILAEYVKKLDEFLKLKESSEKYLKLLEEGEEVKIYKVDGRYFTKLHIKDWGYDNCSSMLFCEIDLNEPKIKRLRKQTKINVRIYNLAPIGKGIDFSLLHE